MRGIKKVKPVLQMEVTECGAATLCMILDYYGKSVSMEELRLECGVSRNGVNAKNIAKAAMLHGLKPRALKVGVNAAKSLNFPVIIHWNMDHFVVLCGFNKGGAVIVDPAVGFEVVSEEKFSDSFTGIALEFTPTENFVKNKKAKEKTEYIKACIKTVMPVTVIFFVCELCMLAANGVVPFLNSVYINRVLLESKLQQVSFVTAVLLACLLLVLFGGVLRASAADETAKVLNARISLGMFEHLLKLPIEFFLQRNVGELAMRQSEAVSMGRLLVSMLPFIVTSVFQALIYLVLLIFMNTSIAIIGIFMVVINTVSVIVFSERYREKVMRSERDRSALQSRISQTVDAIETVKSCGCEDTIFERLLSAGSVAVNARTEIEKTNALAGSLFTFLNAFASAAVIVTGVWEILAGTITTGYLIALQGIMAAMLAPMGDAVSKGLNIQLLAGMANRTNDIMSYKADSGFADDEHKALAETDGSIEVENISFGYSPLDEPLLKDFSLSIKKGESLAITGESGSGKSTVAKLIAGLFCENEGKIYFGQLERKDIGHYGFYSEVGVVSQNIRLFEGSVLDNITMFDNTIAYSDVVAAAKAACIHEDIIKRPLAYREQVSENGRNFSGGQRQRIEIARAIAKKPKILIMDEATSALDTDTEMKIMKAVADMGITTIIVSHRLSAIKYCDKIIVMNNGAVAESGTHEELMEMQGKYAELLREGDAV